MELVNPSTALAQVLVDELIRGGVRDVVLSPGSRSAALALAFADADLRGQIRLHSQIDERSAAFLALGLAKGTRLPVPVVCTSGTAAANFHPAVLEASHTDTPLVLLTADRPNELRGTGANQTTNQIGLFGDAVRFFAEVGVPEAQIGQVRYWRSLTARALDAASTGPVHLNLAFREPLLPDGDESWLEPLTGRADGLPWTTVLRGEPANRRDLGITRAEKGVIVVGHDQGGISETEITDFAHESGWPLISENPLSFVGAIPHASLFLGAPKIRQALAADVAIVVGKIGLSRSVLTYVGETPKVVAVDVHSEWSDPIRRANIVVDSMPAISDESNLADGSWSGQSTWAAQWRSESERVAGFIASGADEWGEAVLARNLAALLPEGTALFVGSSRPVRDIEAFAVPRDGIEVYGNRGLAGIDGSISTAVGIALSRSGRTYAVMGDLTFLHDSNGLLCDTEIPLTIVVVDNNGGGIFNTLPQRGYPNFELVFGTPHGRNLAMLVNAFGHEVVETSDAAGFREALLRKTNGLLVIVAHMPSREVNATTLATLTARITE